MQDFVEKGGLRVVTIGGHEVVCMPHMTAKVLQDACDRCMTEDYPVKTRTFLFNNVLQHVWVWGIMADGGCTLHCELIDEMDELARTDPAEYARRLEQEMSGE